MRCRALVTRRGLVTLAAVVRGASALSTPARRLHDVARRYEPLRRHPTLFDPERVADWLSPEFVELARAVDAACPPQLRVEAFEVFSFPLLRDDACAALIEEVESFAASGLPARRPNSMNNYGLILNEIGLRPALSALQAAVAPVARALFPFEGAALDRHHSFVVSYRADEDKGLDMHTDDSDVTLNCCLGEAFEASGLTFCGDVGTPGHRRRSHRYAHETGRAVMHLGRRRHGADDISSGHRVNLIMWNYNDAYRASSAYRTRMLTYQREGAAPDPECVSWTHDRDWRAVRGEYPTKDAERFANTAWCPPPQFCYDTMGAEGSGVARGKYRDIDPRHRDLPL